MLTIEERKELKRYANIELAKRSFWHYNQTKYPNAYKDDRLFLKEISDTMQQFYENKLIREDGKPYDRLIINAPPRHYKTLTASNFCEWVLGKNSSEREMVGNYNEKLSTRFGKKVRDSIQEINASNNKIVFHDIFNATIKRGNSAAQLWSLEDQHFSFLSTSPTGTATGFGATLLIIDDMIKSALEAFNENRLEEVYDWYKDTMQSRLEEGGKIIIVMTRWAINDLCGKLLKEFPKDWFLLSYKAFDGEKMLCPEVLSLDTYKDRVRILSPEIAAANYNQIPIQSEGRLYKKFLTYTELPSGVVYNYTDTADEGNDYLCSINFIKYMGQAYIVDILYTKEGMEITEPATARMLQKDRVFESFIESNSGGRGFGRNVERIIKENIDKGINKSKPNIIPFYQSNNKKARILASSGWVQENVIYPANWHVRFPEFHEHVTSYLKEGTSKTDDPEDVLAGIFEKVCTESFLSWS